MDHTAKEKLEFIIELFNSSETFRQALQRISIETPDSFQNLEPSKEYASQLKLTIEATKGKLPGFFITHTASNDFIGIILVPRETALRLYISPEPIYEGEEVTEVKNLFIICLERRAVDISLTLQFLEEEMPEEFAQIELYLGTIYGEPGETHGIFPVK